MIQGINTGRYWARPNKNYPLHDYTKDNNIYRCSLCGQLITRKASLCKTCACAQRRKVERPDPIVLAQEILNSNFCAVGRKYGVTDNAIRKWCKAYGLPTKKQELQEWLNKQ